MPSLVVSIVITCSFGNEQNLHGVECFPVENIPDAIISRLTLFHYASILTRVFVVVERVCSVQTPTIGTSLTYMCSVRSAFTHENINMIADDELTIDTRMLYDVAVNGVRPFNDLL